MSNRIKKVVFVASTGGHVGSLIDLANRLRVRGLITPAILEYPSDLGLDKTHVHELSAIDEYIWHGNGVFRRDQIKIINASHNCGTLPEVALDYVLRWLIARSGNAISVLSLYAAISICAIPCGVKWLFSTPRSAQTSRQHSLLREICIDAFRLLGKFRFLLRFTEIPLIGGTIQYAIQRVFFGVLKCEAELQHLTRFFASHQPDLIILPEQNCGYSHHVLIAWARQSGVPILVMPYSIAGREEWANSFINRPGCQVRGLLFHVLARAFPEWTYLFKGKLLIPPIDWLITCEYLDCPPSIPWVTNSGPDVVVAVDSLFVKTFYEREGVDTSSWHVVGSIAEDRLHAGRQNQKLLREELSTRLGLDPDKPIILVGLPPDQFDMGLPPDMEFSAYPSLAKFMIAAAAEVAGSNYNVIVNLHPRIKREDISGFDLGKARIFDGPIVDILPAAHLYISVSSATIRWAAACGIPVLNYDVYRYNYSDFIGLKGVVDVKTRSDFTNHLQTITSDSTYYDRLSRAQVMDARRLFRADGKSEQRISHLISNLTSRPTDYSPSPNESITTNQSSSLLGQAWIYALANAFNSAIPLLLLPILTRYLAPEEYGILAMFTAFTAVIVAIASLGTHGAITREYYLRDQSQFSAFVGTCICILSGCSIVLLILLQIFGAQITDMTGIPKHWLFAAVLAGAGQLLCSIALVIWQVRERPLTYGMLQISTSLLNVLLSLGLVVGLGMGWQGRVIGQVSAVIIIGLVGTAILAKSGWIRLELTSSDVRKALRYGIPLVFHGLGATAVAMTDRTLIANFVSLDETGLYVVAAQIAMVITFLADSFNRAYAPWLFTRLNSGDIAIRRSIVIGTYWYFAVTLVVTGLLNVTAPFLVGNLIGPDFSGALKYFFWLSLAGAFCSMYYMVTLYIQFSGKTEYLALITILVGIFNFPLCYLLIHWYGGIGASQATAISQFVAFAATWIVAAKVVRMGWFLKRRL